MSGFGSRVRVRIKPSVSLGNQLIGNFYFLGEPWTSWKPLSEVGGDGRHFAYNSLNFVKKEYCQDETHPGPPFKTGGPFARTVIEVPAFSPQGQGFYYTNSPSATAYGYGYLAYEGGFICQHIPGDGANDWKFQNDFNDYPVLVPDVTSLGPTAWRKTAPKIEIGGLAIALGESRDFPGMLRKTSKAFHNVWRDLSVRRHYLNNAGKFLRTPRGVWSMQPKEVANNYLNTQFGWVPFLSDVGKLIEVYQNSEKYIHRIKSENGMSVRKRKVLEKSTVVETVAAGSSCLTSPSFPYSPGALNSFFTAPPTYRVEKRTSTFTHTSGKFRYYRPEFDDSDMGRYNSNLSEVSRNLAIHGLRVNPSNLYKVMPWSWLTDWFSNVGDNVANFSSAYQDSMASEYFFVMQHKVTELFLIQKLPMLPNAVTLEYSRKIDVKQRNGDVGRFGLSLDVPTSAFQLSILAALGLSRT